MTLHQAWPSAVRVCLGNLKFWWLLCPPSHFPSALSLLHSHRLVWPLVQRWPIPGLAIATLSVPLEDIPDWWCHPVLWSTEVTLESRILPIGVDISDEIYLICQLQQLDPFSFSLWGQTPWSVIWALQSIPGSLEHALAASVQWSAPSTLNTQAAQCCWSVLGSYVDLCHKALMPHLSRSELPFLFSPLFFLFFLFLDVNHF